MTDETETGPAPARPVKNPLRTRSATVAGLSAALSAGALAWVQREYGIELGADAQAGLAAFFSGAITYVFAAVIRSVTSAPASFRAPLVRPTAKED